MCLEQYFEEICPLDWDKITYRQMDTLTIEKEDDLYIQFIYQYTQTFVFQEYSK